MKRVLFFNASRFYTLVFTTLLFLILFPKLIIAQGYSVDCPNYCPQTNPSHPIGVCSGGNPDPTVCVSSNFLCASNPTQVCYCCSSANTPTPTPSCKPPWQSCDLTHPCCSNPPGYVCSGGYCVPYSTPTPSTLTPTPTPAASITPSFPKCTGTDGNDPCIHYFCGFDPYNNQCLAHQGQCFEPVPGRTECHPNPCRCGFSSYDCPNDSINYAWVCKAVGVPGLSCSQEDQDHGIVKCSAGGIVCDGSAGQIPCTSDDQCRYECMNDAAYCDSGICRVPLGCGDIPGGPGSCVESQYCAPEDVWTITDACAPPLVCCAAPRCRGIFSGTLGSCYFMSCPPDTFFEGVNPPYPETGCPLLNWCCTQPGDDWLDKNALNIHCTTADGRDGIKTAIGCIATTSQNALLQFILPWAIGVAGGSAFLLIIVAGFLIMTSGGDPQKAKAGKELLGAAVAGLLLIIFSVYILDVIGIRIFRFPGLLF